MAGFSWLQRLQNKIRVQPGSHVSLGKNVKMLGCNVNIKGRNNRLEIGDNVRLQNVFLQIKGNDSVLTIGAGTSIGRGSFINSREWNTVLSIGENCSFSRNAKVMTSDGHALYKDGERFNPAGDIVIEDGVWLADSATILKGVTVGHDAVIGINAVVTKDVPPNAVAAGNPARIVKEGVYKQRDASGRAVDPEELKV